MRDVGNRCDHRSTRFQHLAREQQRRLRIGQVFQHVRKQYDIESTEVANLFPIKTGRTDVQAPARRACRSCRIRFKTYELRMACIGENFRQRSFPASHVQNSRASGNHLSDDAGNLISVQRTGNLVAQRVHSVAQQSSGICIWRGSPINEVVAHLDYRSIYQGLGCSPALEMRLSPLQLALLLINTSPNSPANPSFISRIKIAVVVMPEQQ